jgi:hypothetical protein
MQWIERFHLVQLIGPDVRLAQRGHAEINEGRAQGCPTEAAREAGAPGMLTQDDRALVSQDLHTFSLRLQRQHNVFAVTPGKANSLVGARLEFMSHGVRLRTP